MAIIVAPDCLLEVTPGAGWLAHEFERIVWIPTSVDDDIAHRCIEPLLTADTFDSALRMVRNWPDSDVPFVFMSTETPPRIVTHGFDLQQTGVRALLTPTELRSMPAPFVQSVSPFIRLVHSPLGAEPASGMLVEGIIRAGGWKWHFLPLAEHDQQRTIRWELDSDRGRWEIGSKMIIGRGDQDLPAGALYISVPDPAVSRIHAIVLPGERPSIVDSLSTNGTWVVKETGETSALKKEEPFPLSNGDVIIVGQTLFTVRERPA